MSRAANRIIQSSRKKPNRIKVQTRAYSTLVVHIMPHASPQTRGSARCIVARVRTHPASASKCSAARAAGSPSSWTRPTHLAPSLGRGHQTQKHTKTALLRSEKRATSCCRGYYTNAQKKAYRRATGRGHAQRHPMLTRGRTHPVDDALVPRGHQAPRVLPHLPPIRLCISTLPARHTVNQIEPHNTTNRSKSYQSTSNHMISIKSSQSNQIKPNPITTSQITSHQTKRQIQIIKMIELRENLPFNRNSGTSRTYIPEFN